MAEFGGGAGKKSPDVGDSGDTNWGRGLSYGMEIGIGVAVGGFGGHWLDKHFGWTPWGLIVGLLIGCAAGMYLLIKDAIRMNQD